MPLEIRQRPAARLDLVDIWEYVAWASSPERADHILDSLFDSYERIAEYPQIGRARPELAPSLRSFVAGSYVIFYEPTVEAVEVVRVVRAERDIDALFSGEEA